MDLQQVAPGLWRWTAPHPDWELRRQEDDPADWERDVGCVAYEAGDALVLIDPLLADGDFSALDRPAASKSTVAVLTTLPWHRRSGDELAERYGASSSIPKASRRSRSRAPGRRCTGSRTIAPSCPETAFSATVRRAWGCALPRGFAISTDSRRDDLRDALRPLLALPIGLVLISHGEPVVACGRAELERALA